MTSCENQEFDWIKFDVWNQVVPSCAAVELRSSQLSTAVARILMIFSSFISAFRSCNIWNFQCWVHVQLEIVSGATLPSCTTALILLAHNKRDQSYQNRCIFVCYTCFDVSYRTFGPAFGESTKESYRNGEHFNSILAFRKIHQRIRSPSTESLEIKTGRTFFNTKHNWSSTKLRYLANIAPSLLGITVLNNFQHSS